MACSPHAERGLRRRLSADTPTLHTPSPGSISPSQLWAWAAGVVCSGLSLVVCCSVPLHTCACQQVLRECHLSEKGVSTLDMQSDSSCQPLECQRHGVPGQQINRQHAFSDSMQSQPMLCTPHANQHSLSDCTTSTPGVSGCGPTA